MTHARFGLALCATLALASCAPALREPRSLDAFGAELFGAVTAPPPSGEVERLLAGAERSFDRRPDPAAVADAQRSFLDAARADASRVEALIGFLRVTTWKVEHEREAKKREALVSAAVQAGQWCGRRAPGNPACDYWLALALGQQARERPSTSHDSLKKMIEALTRAVAVDPLLDDAGPSRVLALVRLRAPGWPAGPGDAETGLEDAQRAVELRPDHPSNQLALGEGLRKNGREREARAAYGRALALAQQRASAGDPEAPEWVGDAEKALVSGNR